jgi:RND family efflux transporter MFP subunit
MLFFLLGNIAWLLHTAVSPPVMKRSIVLRAVACGSCTILAAAALVSCSKSEGARKKAAPPARSVNVARAEIRQLERIIVATGSLMAHEKASLSVKVPGRVESVAVDLGSAVKTGDLILQLEQIDYELRQKQAAAALAQARARVGLPLDGTDDTLAPELTSAGKQGKAVLEEATKNRDRVLNLAKEGISSKSELDTVEAAYTVALNRYEAALEDSRTLLAVLSQRRIEFEMAKQAWRDATIVAPFDGTIQERVATAGEYLQVGAPVASLVQTDPLRLHLEVPERQSIYVRTGQTVRILVEGDTNAYTGKIARLSPALDEQNRMLVVEADVRNRGGLRAGLFVRAHIVTTDHDPGLTIPPAALITFAGLEKIFVVRDGKAAERNVVTGRSGADWIEVKGGVKAGDFVVLDPGNLRAGERVVATLTANTIQTTQANAEDDVSASSGQ